MTVNAVRAAVMNFFFMFIIYNNYVCINVKNRVPSPLLQELLGVFSLLSTAICFFGAFVAALEFLVQGPVNGGK